MATLSFTVKNSSNANLQSSNKDYEQSIEAINIKLTPWTAPGTLLSADV